jgi:4Fe-4S ferredoxin
MKQLKTETENELKVERILHAKRYALTLNKNLCTGCGICKIICPREAIEIKTIPKKAGQKAEHPTIDFDEQKCHYCGVCNSMCPFGALKVQVDGEHIISVVKTESFPQLIREIEVDTKKCKLDCVECEKACPLELIKITLRTPDGKEVTDIKSASDKENLSISVDVKKDLCPGCRLCELKCPEDAIHVRKLFHGVLRINDEKCPEGCKDCVDVCPITGTLFLSDDGKVHVNEAACVYCGACKLVCPVEDALELQRTYICHTPVHSGAWNKALEKLTSTTEMTKELKAKGVKKLRESVEKRLALRAS